MKKLYQDAAWHLSSNLLPFLAGVIFIPLILGIYGKSSFTFISIAWTVIVFFVLFDGGIGRALTFYLSHDRKAEDDHAKDQGLIWTALVTVASLGFAIIIVLMTLDKLIFKLLNLNDPAFAGAVIYLVISLLFVTLSTLQKGILEAKQKFKASSVMRSIDGLSLFVFPYLFALIEPSLGLAYMSLLASRILVFVLYMLILARYRLIDFELIAVRKDALKKILSFGGWVSVSSFIQPAINLIERFIALRWISSAAYAFYLAPFEIISRFSSIATSISVVLFPSLIRTKIANQRRQLIDVGSAFIILLVMPAAFILSIFAPQVLGFWLGSEFAFTAHKPALVIASGLVIASLAYLPFIITQSRGRADLTAKLHLIEVIPVLTATWLLAKHYGLIGLAYAWLFRVGLDFILQTLCATYCDRGLAPTITKHALLGMVSFALLTVLGQFDHDWVRLLTFLTLAAIYLNYLIVVYTQYKHNVIDFD
jgi:O-antigen/teichoic acid export membrane protein